MFLDYASCGYAVMVEDYRVLEFRQNVEPKLRQNVLGAEGLKS